MDREGNEAFLGIFFGRLGAKVEGPLLENGTLSPNARAAAVGRSQLLDRHRAGTRIHPGLAWERAKVGHGRRVPSPLLILMTFALYDAECPVHLREHAETETARSFKCFVPLATGAQCEFCSATMRGLISHEVRAHGFYDLAQRAVITNE